MPSEDPLPALQYLMLMMFKKVVMNFSTSYGALEKLSFFLSISVTEQGLKFLVWVLNSLSAYRDIILLIHLIFDKNPILLIIFRFIFLAT